MTYHQTHRFGSDLQELAIIARALSHPARLAILKYLAACKTCISGDISNEIPLSRSTVSQHLQELKKIGLIKGEIEGVTVNYCISNQHIKDMIRKFEIFFQDISDLNNLEC